MSDLDSPFKCAFSLRPEKGTLWFSACESMPNTGDNTTAKIVVYDSNLIYYLFFINLLSNIEIIIYSRIILIEVMPESI